MEAYGYDQPPAYVQKDGTSAPPPPQQFYPVAAQSPYPAYPQSSGQQQQVVVVNGQPSLIATYLPPDRYNAHMVTSCFVLWCCNPLFGLIAFILAAIADSTSASDREGARRLGRASFGVSIAGIIVSVIIVIVVVAVHQTSCCEHHVSGMCFCHRSSAYDSSTACSASHVGITYYDGVYCYYD